MMTEHRRGGVHAGLPGWLTVVVVLWVLVLLGYNIVVVGPEGYPISMMLGGLLGAYSGLDQLLKRRPPSDPENRGPS